ncbi:hypothetical protein C1H46_033699 [Malus baccata]|uniref:UDP-glucose:glycoprotein glucosyltransferase n=1 Tax=Malus baccata TaxID=106549 RepID=A0A540L326_MALBA|nr:hypothetical protein C1H46_033699 [Malus baccata]
MRTRFKSAFCAVIVLVCLGASGIGLVSGQNRRPKNVQAAVRAKWSGTPLLLEAGELLSKEQKDHFWDFIDAWHHSEKDDAESYTAKGCLKKIVKHGLSILNEPLASLFEFSLMLRSTSPRLVLYRQLAEEALSSFPLVDETNSSSDSGISETNELMEGKRSDLLNIGRNPKSPNGKCCWVDTGGALLFDPADLKIWLQSPRDSSGDSFQQPELFEFDHIHFDSSVGSPVAVLYGALGTDCFREFHLTLVEAAKEGKAKYVVRQVLPSGCDAKIDRCGAVGTRDSLNLGGYGVELALKNMEYKAMDDSAIKKGVTLEDPRIEDLSQEVRGFIFSKILERKPELSSEIMAFRDYLLSSTISDTLDVWELKDLGHQTAQRIVQASDPLQAMQEINQNFPSIVSSLSRMKLNDSVKDEISANQRMIPPGKSLMALNGALLNIEDIDLYLLLDLVHQDLSLADQFSKLKIPHGTIRKLLASLPPPESNMLRVDFRSDHVQYLNDIEEDDMYRRWRSNLNEILMPVFPGQLRYIRKNLFHAVSVIDPSTVCGLQSIDMILSLYENNFPMRFGVVLYSSKFIKQIETRGSEDDHEIEEDMSSLIIRLFIYIKENHGIQTAFQFLSNINKLRIDSEDSADDALEMHHVEGAFIETVLPNTKSPPQDLLLKLEKEQTFKELSLESSMFVFKLGLAKLQCCLLMNGLVLESNEEALINSMNDELPRIQEQVYYGHINSRTDVLDKFLSESSTTRYNPQIIAGGKPRFISLPTSILGGDGVLNDINYLHSPETMDDLKPVTHLLAVNIASKKGMKLLHEGLQYLIEASNRARVGVLFSVNQDADVSSHLFVKGTESTQEFIDKVCELAEANGLSSKAYRFSLSEFSDEKLRKSMNKVSQFLYRQLGLESGVNAVITNGRVTVVNDGGTFLSHDLRLLESLEFAQRIKHIVEIIEEVKWEDMDPDILTSKFISDTIMSVSSSMAMRDRSSESARFEVLSAQYRKALVCSLVTILLDTLGAIVLNNENASIHIDAVIDPLSPFGQKLSSILRVLWKYTQPSMRIVLNPLSSLVDLPLKNYYRYVLPTVDDFSSTDYTINGPKAFFANMPLSKTLTMNLDVPDPWLVEPVIAVHDLDNILLENLGETRTLQAVFELEALVLTVNGKVRVTNYVVICTDKSSTGHCSEKGHDHPRGLQLIIGTKSTPHLVDTLVMANLGYWQMKVSPGVWYLQLAPGRSSELYFLKEDGNESGSKTLSKRITIDDLRGKVVHMEVAKKKGKEHEKLLVPDGEDNSHDDKEGSSWNSNFLKWASGFIGGGEQSKKSESTSAEQRKGGRHGKTINIFSIASGHLYERFLKIMILSVLKNTHRPVKFWFIKNYLSPQFKDVIPPMAQEYGFEYELITYKWPTWLHKQKEKQRIIWAYKILFLDVIFPLSLEKVIFVDADQIVRADMGELYDMDIKGRPLAYTPFCDNNKDMDGYRFWRQGFWKEHLRGRSYHISALYVVDLKKFRETAAGDNLRVFYETLSKDPNSLSNLDQASGHVSNSTTTEAQYDLPNYAQHTVPIFSLPQEWLWCESWCGNATKSKAKTIDLCNNPMTKEPKLQGARRIVSEWPDLDLEARQFTAKILGDELDIQEPAPLPNEPDKSVTGSPEEDLESKAEL